MISSPRILKVVALTDMILAVSIACYVGFKISKGAELIPGNLNLQEKTTRLVVYTGLLYIFLGIQLLMAIQLMTTTRWVMEEPLKALRKIRSWLEWSFVYLIFTALHGATALLLMKPGPRKSVILALSTVQVLFRLIGILITTKYQFALPYYIPAKV